MSRTTFNISRRQALGAGLAGLAAATAGLPGMAAVPMQGVARPEVYRFKLGAFEVTTINDGAIQLDGPHPIFGQNVSAEEVQALAEANFLPPTRMEIGFTQTLVNTGDDLILFDTGNGAGRRPDAGQLRARLAVAGLKPEDVTVVAVTHFHPDHIGGMTEDGAVAYPNARYVFGASEYDFWSPPEKAEAEATARVGQLVQAGVVPVAGKATMAAPGDSVVSGVDVVKSHGHTPGHVSYHVESEGKRLLILGDVCNHYVVSVQRPEWHVRFDMDKEMAVAARKEVLGMIAADKIPFVGYHMPFPAVGYLEARDDGFRYVAASYQLNL